MALCLYAISFLCLLNLELKNNKKNWKLDIPCFISFIIVCSMFLYHYVQEIIDVTNNIGNELFMPNLVKLVAELCIVIIILIVFFLRYKKTIYYEKTHK
jgi:hypothetical protein